MKEEIKKAVCERCEMEATEVWPCERCETMICDKCQVEYNQFTQIDFNCCKTCGKDE